MKNIELMIAFESNTILEVLDIINKNGLGTAFILNHNHKFSGLVTDGDIRRSILNEISLQIAQVFCQKDLHDQYQCVSTTPELDPKFWKHFLYYLEKNQLAQALVQDYIS